ncbi:MAG: glucose-1-phosphate thymidylyltransferase, partial [Muribaculum sp.]|nr:glucose-1-phosphate thymidylyltransferase [Muribaculum sp.]
MANIILYDPSDLRDHLKPLTLTRPVAAIRFGIMTMAEKWHKATDATVYYHTADYLQSKYPDTPSPADTDLLIAANICPSAELIQHLSTATTGTAILTPDGTEIARIGHIQPVTTVTLSAAPLSFNSIPDIFNLNGDALLLDYRAITAGRHSQPLPANCTLIGQPFDADGHPNLFIEEGATLNCSSINVTDGPVYIGRQAEVMEGCHLRGPIALCEHSTFNMGTKVYGKTTIGPWCKIGGEINNVVIFGYSNKAHDGFLGNAVIGEWCNLGAGCVASNLKNNYAKIRLWDYATRSFAKTGLQFCGLIMGDHSKAGIQTMFNTATVVGVGCNVYGAGFPRTFIASFPQGGKDGFTPHPLDKMLDTARMVMAR